MIKIHGGTPRTQTSLCKTCRRAVNIKGMNLQEITMCHAVDPSMRITFPVVECSDFEEKNTPTKYDMEDIAWRVESKSRGPMGFTDGERTEIVISPPKKGNVFEGEL